MLEKKFEFCDDLDIQIRKLENKIKETMLVNNRIKLNIQKKLLILQQIDATLNNKEA